MTNTYVATSDERQTMTMLRHLGGETTRDEGNYTSINVMTGWKTYTGIRTRRRLCMYLYLPRAEGARCTDSQ